MAAELDRLAKVFDRVFGLQQIDDTLSIVSYDPWDSMAHITLVLELEAEYGVNISTDEAIEITSVPEILSMLSRMGTL